MSQPILATFENGVLRPDTPLDLPAGTRVHIVILDPQPALSEEEQRNAWQGFDKLCEEISVDTGGERLTRDQLYDRN